MDRKSADILIDRLIAENPGKEAEIRAKIEPMLLASALEDVLPGVKLPKAKKKDKEKGFIPYKKGKGNKRPVMEVLVPYSILMKLPIGKFKTFETPKELHFNTEAVDVDNVAKKEKPAALVNESAAERASELGLTVIQIPSETEEVRSKGRVRRTGEKTFDVQINIQRPEGEMRFHQLVVGSQRQAEERLEKLLSRVEVGAYGEIPTPKSFYVVAQNEDDAYKVLDVVEKYPPGKRGEKYHREMGKALGYSQKDIDYFINRYIKPMQKETARYTPPDIIAYITNERITNTTTTPELASAPLVLTEEQQIAREKLTGRRLLPGQRAETSEERKERLEKFPPEPTPGQQLFEGFPEPGKTIVEETESDTIRLYEQRQRQRPLLDWEAQPLYHVSASRDLTVIEPDVPREDVIRDPNSKLFGKLVGVSGEDVNLPITLPKESRSVAFGQDLRMVIHFNPILGGKGYIYEPETREVARPIYKEVSSDPNSPRWADFVLTREHRFYQPVPVKPVGEYVMKPNAEGLLEPEITWYNPESKE